MDNELKNNTCYLIKIEFNNGVTHDFLSSELPFINGQHMSFHGYQEQKDRFHYVVLNNVNYYTAKLIHKEGE